MTTEQTLATLDVLNQLAVETGADVPAKAETKEAEAVDYAAMWAKHTIMEGDAKSNGDAIQKLIGRIDRALAKVHQDITVAAVSTVVHAVQYGDATMATRLIETLSSPGGRRYRAEVMAWFRSYAPLVWDEDAKQFTLEKAEVKAHKAAIMGNKLAYVDRLYAEPWFDLRRPAKDFEGWSLKDQLEKLLKKVDELKANAKKAPKCDFTGLEGLRRLYETTAIRK